MPDGGTTKKTLQEIAEFLDLHVLIDLDGDNEGTHTWPVYYLGEQNELDAGLYGFSATPSFKSQAELEVYANEHFAELEAEFVTPYFHED